jgi:hypothetical protein
MNADIICIVAKYLDISTLKNLKNTNYSTNLALKTIYKQKLQQVTLDIFKNLQSYNVGKFTDKKCPINLTMLKHPLLKRPHVVRYEISLRITCPAFINLNTLKQLWESQGEMYIAKFESII